MDEEKKRGIQNGRSVCVSHSPSSSPTRLQPRALAGWVQSLQNPSTWQRRPSRARRKGLQSLCLRRDGHSTWGRYWTRISRPSLALSVTGEVLSIQMNWAKTLLPLSLGISGSGTLTPPAAPLVTTIGT